MSANENSKMLDLTKRLKTLPHRYSCTACSAERKKIKFEMGIQRYLKACKSLGL